MAAVPLALEANCFIWTGGGNDISIGVSITCGHVHAGLIAVGALTVGGTVCAVYQMRGSLNLVVGAGADKGFEITDIDRGAISMTGSSTRAGWPGMQHVPTVVGTKVWIAGVAIEFA